MSMRLNCVRSPLDERQELPFGGKLLADRERNVGQLPQCRVGAGRFVANGFFEEVQSPARHLLAIAGGLRHAQPMVEVDAKDHLVPQRLAALDRPFGGFGDAFAWLIDLVRPLARRDEADRLPSLRLEFEHLLDDFRARGFRTRGRERRNEIALLAAQQLVDRHSERLALDVVQGDVDRRDRSLQDAATLEILAAIHLLPDAADLHRVLADEKLAVVLDGADHRLLARRQSAFAPAVHALVGFDLDDQLVAGADPNRIGLDGGDLEFRDHDQSCRANSVSPSKRCMRF